MGKKRKLFITFEGIVKGLEEQRVTEEDLSCGLFFFGCSRFTIRDALAQLSAAGNAELVKMIEDKLFRADHYGRSRWVNLTEKPCYSYLNFLLVANGYKSLRPKQYYLYTPEEITRLMQEVNPELEVVS